MILGVGIDLVDIRRLERLLKRFGDRFIQKIFTPAEQAYAMQSPNPVRAFSNRFAAKEAASKALHTGMREGITWQDIEVSRTSSGAPLLHLHGKAYEKLLTLIPSRHTPSTHVSFSDELPYSAAFVIISAIAIE